MEQRPVVGEGVVLAEFAARVAACRQLVDEVPIDGDPDLIGVEHGRVDHDGDRGDPRRQERLDDLRRRKPPQWLDHLDAGWCELFLFGLEHA